MSRSHSHGGAICEHGTKKACLVAQREKLGKCVSMTESKSEPEPCLNWAIDVVEGRGYCGQHIASILHRAAERRRREEAQARLDAAIDRFMAWSKDHPSVWDRMPDGWQIGDRA